MSVEFWKFVRKENALMNRRGIKSAIVLVLGVAGVAVAGNAPKDIVDTAIGAGSFNTLVTAIKAAELADTLKSEGPFTVFAPTDAAFAKLPPGTLDKLLKDPAKLRQVLKYHVVSGRVMAADAAKLSSAKSLIGQPIAIDASKGVRVENANVVTADIKCTNGVIHVIDAVMMPKADILDTAAAAGSFKTLLAAIHAADLADTLRGPGPFTVFAPTDAAFARISRSDLDALLRDKEKLTAVLLYHVVPGEVMAADVVKLSSAKTAGGKSVKIDASDGVRVNEAKVIKTDIQTANGVIHVIDAVLMPG